MPRKRRTAEEAKTEILATAQHLVRADGPEAWRLDDVAAAMGVSRQAVLHHFATKEALLRAVVRAGYTALFADLSAAVRDSRGHGARRLVAKIDDVARAAGKARLGAWLLLSGQGVEEAFFADAAEGLAALWTDAETGVSVEAAQRRLLLVTSAIFGDALFGARIRSALGLADGEREREAFLDNLAATVFRPSD